MITLDDALRLVSGLEEEALRRWIAREWVLPLEHEGRPAFREIDIARIRLIVSLSDEVEVGEKAVPVVLSLLDQLHEQRRQMRRLCAVLAGASPDEDVRDVVERLARSGGDRPGGDRSGGDQSGDAGRS